MPLALCSILRGEGGRVVRSALSALCLCLSDSTVISSTPRPHSSAASLPDPVQACLNSTDLLPGPRCDFTLLFFPYPNEPNELTYIQGVFLQAEPPSLKRRGGGDAAPRHRAVSAAPAFSLAPILFAARGR